VELARSDSSPSPAPRGAYLEMVGAVLAGDGLERVAAIAAEHAGAPVAVVVPRLGVPVEGWEPYERYVARRVAGGSAPRPPEVTEEVPIASGDATIGAVLLLGRGGPGAADALHAAAVAAMTEVAVAEAREETEQRLRSSFLEELLRREELDPDDVARRAARLGLDLRGACVGVCVDPGGRAPGRILAAIASELRGALAQAVDGRVYALVPGDPEEVRAAAPRLSRHAVVGISTRHEGPLGARRALEEAELIVDVKRAGGGIGDDDVGDGTYRLLFRVLASRPEEVRSFYEDTVAPIVRYDEQYSTPLLETLEAYLARDCSISAAAETVFAHRHTISYRLERIAELSGLNPLKTEDRERLGLGLKAYRIIQPTLPR
jgi:hypothetical protein